MKKVTLTIEERKLLEHLDNETLAFIKWIYNHKSFPNLLKVMELLVDLEKNQFFTEIETDEKLLATKHAYARGKVAGVLTNLHLYAGAELELTRRSKENKK